MTTAPPASDLLAAIVAATRRIVDVRSSQVSLHQMEERAAAVSPRPGVFKRGLAQEGRYNVIAECKRRSPSRGVLRQQYDPAAIARAYAGAGAVAISVLTEPTFFDGSLDHLVAVRDAVELPLLRKDFIVDRYQILEARAVGADAILLIVAALDSGELGDLLQMAQDEGLDVLVEVHDERELAVAIDTGASIVGVNNRNLRTLSVDRETTVRLIEKMPAGVIAVAESGLRTAGDLRGLRDSGYSAFLIGERLMTEAEPGEALAELIRE